MTTQEILKVEFEEIKKDLIKSYEEKKIKASGKWAKSLEVEVIQKEYKHTARIFGEKYTEQLVFGRKPGAFPPIKAIEQWIKDKGIQPIEKNLKISSLAFLIARKISQEGTKYYKQGGNDFIEKIITPQRIQEIIDKVSELNVTVFTRGLIEQLKQVA
jgi:hypothetical protein